LLNPGKTKKMKHFLKYTLVWISQNLSIPFWMVGHVHLSVNVYEDLHEILMSLGMNIIVAIGFIIDYLQSKKEELKQQEQ
jgi:hypothetical protein